MDTNNIEDKNQNKIAGKEDKKEFSKFNMFYALSLGMGLGLCVAIPLVVFLLIGLFIDRKLYTTPLFLIIFILLSFGVTALEVRNLILPFLEKRSQKK